MSSQQFFSSRLSPSEANEPSSSPKDAPQPNSKEGPTIGTGGLSVIPEYVEVQVLNLLETTESPTESPTIAPKPNPKGGPKGGPSVDDIEYPRLRLTVSRSQKFDRKEAI